MPGMLMMGKTARDIRTASVITLIIVEATTASIMAVKDKTTPRIIIVIKGEMARVVGMVEREFKFYHPRGPLRCLIIRTPGRGRRVQPDGRLISPSVKAAWAPYTAISHPVFRTSP